MMMIMKKLNHEEASTMVRTLVEKGTKHTIQQSRPQGLHTFQSRTKNKGGCKVKAQQSKKKKNK